MLLIRGVIASDVTAMCTLQDFLSTQMDSITALHSDISLAETWLKHLGDVAQRLVQDIDNRMLL